MKRIVLFVFAAAAVLAVSCRKDDSIGGTVNPTDVMDINTYDWMAQTDETKIPKCSGKAKGLSEGW